MNSRKAFLVGLIGAGIQASRAPHLHEQEARALGLRYFYQLLDLERHGIDALPRLLDAAQLLGFAGVNITHPCKQQVLPLLDELSEEAAAIGAVNTVVFANGKRSGHNTDAWGFAESFTRSFGTVARSSVVLLGAGGAGAAIAHAALKLGVQQLSIHDVEEARTRQLVDNLAQQFGRERVQAVTNLATALAAADGLVQATPIGMVGHPGLPLPIALLRSDLWVAEAIYFPLETELLRQARQLGCKTLDGGGMAVFQAAEAFRLFTDSAPDTERMLRHFATLTSPLKQEN